MDYLVRIGDVTEWRYNRNVFKFNDNGNHDLSLGGYLCGDTRKQSQAAIHGLLCNRARTRDAKHPRQNVARHTVDSSSPIPGGFSLFGELRAI